MNKHYLFYLVMIFGLLNQSLYAQKPGMSCDTPIVIGSLPYQTTDDTKNYGDLYDTPQSNASSCGVGSTTNYMAGNDVFYSYTATKSGNISFKMTPTSSYSSIFIYGACPIPEGVSCLAGFANFSTSTRYINNFSVTAGVTYYIVISSSATTQTVGYTLLMQEENCTPPAALTATNLTMTSADLSWSNPSSATKWEIAIQPSGNGVPTGSGTTVSTNPYTAANLSPSTQYQYWVKAKCADNSFTSWAGPYTFNTTICNGSNKCNYIFQMTDTEGNGWNGASMQVKQNGIVVATIGSSFTSGSGPIDITVPLCKDVPFDLYWNNSGLNPQQCTVSIINSFGQTFFTKPAATDTSGQIVYSGVAKCDAPICNTIVTSLSATNIQSHNATLNWTATATTSWDIYVSLKGNPAPTPETAPTYTGVTSNPFTVINLLADYDYNFYVRVHCDNVAPWSAKRTFHTIATCLKPEALNVTNVTTTSASLNWTKGTSTDTTWDILLTKGYPIVPAPPTFDTVPTYNDITTASPFNANNLDPATIYYYYIRTVCPGNDNGAWAGPFIFNTQTCNDSDKCDYKFVMGDRGLDGWNSGRMKVRQNGIVVATIGSSITGSISTATVSLCNNIPFDIYWDIPGTKPNEIELQVQNPFGDIIYTLTPHSITAPTASNPVTLFSSTGNCTPPTCPKPDSLKVSNIKTTEATLSWTENGGATKWEYYVALSVNPTGDPAPPNDSPLNPDHIINSNPFTLKDLQPSTSYFFYVRSFCSDTDISTWTVLTKTTFITTPSNDECIDSFKVPVSTISTIDSLIKGSTFGATNSAPLTNPACTDSTANDVWFNFVATSDKHIISIQNIGGTTTDLNHSLYSGTDCGNLTQIYCSAPNTSLASGLIPGNTYKIRVYTKGSDKTLFAMFDIGITTPPVITNDECNAAIIVPINDKWSAPEQTVTGSLTRATKSNITNTCLGIADDDVWYKFVAKGNYQTITLSNITGTTLNLNYAVYSGDCSALTQLYCSSTNSLKSNYNNYIEGQTYYLRIWSFENTNQVVNFTLSIKKIPTPIKTSTSQYNTNELISKVLMGNPCLNVSNITPSTGTDFGSVNGIGSFDTSESFFPLSKGLVLTTGNIQNIPGTNSSTLSDGDKLWKGDKDLEAIILAGTGQTMNSLNASKLEFDFVSQNDFMSFNYIFASEEYGTFQCAYSDSFAFLLTDLTTNATTNLAVVPGTNAPVSVVTIRDNKYSNNCDSANKDYFDRFYGVTGIDNLEAPINFNGLTKVMTASSSLVPGRKYHIKLVIADRADEQYDSAVFIQGGSFKSGEPECLEHFKLIAFNDINYNGVQDKEESNFNYGSFVIQKNNSTQTTSVSSDKGTYNLYDSDPKNIYSFSYQINPEFATYYSASGTNFSNLNLPTGSGTHTLYFPITLNLSYKNISVSVIPVSDPVPGGTFTNKVIYKNTGTIPASGTITFSTPATVSITGTSENSAVITGNTFTFDFADLQPNEARSILVTLSLASNVSIGDILTSTANVKASSQGSNGGKNSLDQTINKTFTSRQTVTISQASTAITEAHSNIIQLEDFDIDEYLTYTIRFQNTGTVNASGVRIEQALDSKLDIQSIQMVNASHNCVMEKGGNNVIWKFDYINLVGAPQNDELSRGYVTFKIKMLPGVKGGTIVPNQASVYFDENEPVMTNTYNTEFIGESLTTPPFESQNILLFPNPTTDRLQIRLQNSTETLENIAIYDLLGHLVQKSTNIGNDHAEINVRDLVKGVYLIEITTQNQFKSTQKLIVK